MFYAILFAFQGVVADAPVEPAAEAEYETPKPLLWQKLQYGMTPAEVVTALQGVDGVKSARVRGKAEVSVRHNNGGIALAGLKFEIIPVFTDGRLSSVGLNSTDNCANVLERPIATILEGLSDKYGSRPSIDPDTQMSVSRAVLESYSSGMEISQTNTVLTKQIAAALVVSVRAEKSNYVSGGSGIAGALASLSNSMQEERSEECGGHGFNRGDVLISYHRRLDFETMLANERSRARAENYKLKNGL